MKRIHLIVVALVCCMLCNAKPKEPNTYNYQRGVEAIKERDAEKGVEMLLREIAGHPKNGYAYLWKAVGEGMMSQFGNAITDLNYAFRYLPKQDKENRAWAHKVRALIYVQIEDTTAALTDYAEAIRLDPSVYDYYELRGKVYYELKQYELSNADYRQIIKLEPGNTIGYIGYGRNLHDMGRQDEAIEQLTYAAKLDSKCSQALALRAECYAKQKKYAEAVADMISAIEMDGNHTAMNDLIHIDEDGVDYAMPQLKVQMAKNPNNPEWYVYAALVYDNRNLYRKAIALYEKAKSLDADTWYDGRIAIDYHEAGDFANALRHAHYVYDADTTDTNAMILIADIYGEMDSVVRAIEWATKAIAMEPDQSVWYFARGCYYYVSNRWDEAIEDYTMALTINPRYAYPHYNRGRLYLAQGKEELARKDFQQTIAIEPRPDDEHTPCAQYAYWFLGDTAKAFAFMDSVLAKYPHNKYDAACLSSLAGDTTAALDYLRKAFEEGFRHFTHLRKDADLENIRATAGYKALYDEYWQIYQDELNRPNGAPADKQEEVTYEVPFTAANGVTKVDCTINGLPLNFIFDTGASDVTLSQTEANFMLKNGYLSQKDIVGKQRYGTADGSVHVGTVFILNRICFGGLELTGVRASVVGNQKAPLLLGQTVLQRLGKIEIDNERRVIKITTNH